MPGWSMEGQNASGTFPPKGLMHVAAGPHRPLMDFVSPLLHFFGGPKLRTTRRARELAELTFLAAIRATIFPMEVGDAFRRERAGI